MAVRRARLVALVVIAGAVVPTACNTPHFDLTAGDCVDTGRMTAVRCTDATSDGRIVSIVRTTGPSPVPCPSSTRMVTTSEGNEGQMVLVSLCLDDGPPPG